MVLTLEEENRNRCTDTLLEAMKIIAVKKENDIQDGQPHEQLHGLHRFVRLQIYNIRQWSTTLQDEWVPVTTAWRVLRLCMEERPPIGSVPANILNKQTQTADKGWYSSLGVWRGANNSSP